MDQRLGRAGDVAWTEFEDGALLVRRDGARWSLNATAAALWKLCDGRRGSRALARMLARPSNELAAFCAQLLKLGLLRKTFVPAKADFNAHSFTTAFTSAPSMKAHGTGGGSRRRPGPRGLSGPA